MTSLVMAFSGLVHKPGCYALKRGKVYKVVAPDLPESEATAFIAARKLTPCHSCFPVARND